MSARVDRGPHERFMAYMKGWYAGAGRKPIDAKFSEHKTRPDLKEEYERGYSDGQAKGRAAAAKAAKRLGYTPTVLRVADAEAIR